MLMIATFANSTSKHVLRVSKRGRLLGAIAMLLLSVSMPCLRGMAADEPVPAFVAGDRVCFIGDSITHSGYFIGFPPTQIARRS
jgi:hypothetical protein